MTRRHAALGALAAICLGSIFGAGYRVGSTAPVDVTVVHEESGELSDLTVRRDRAAVPSKVDEQWRGNNASPDGVYRHDPANGE